MFMFPHSSQPSPGAAVDREKFFLLPGRQLL